MQQVREDKIEGVIKRKREEWIEYTNKGENEKNHYHLNQR